MVPTSDFQRAALQTMYKMEDNFTSVVLKIDTAAISTTKTLKVCLHIYIYRTWSMYVIYALRQ